MGQESQMRTSRSRVVFFTSLCFFCQCWLSGQSEVPTVLAVQPASPELEWHLSWSRYTSALANGVEEEVKQALTTLKEQSASPSFRRPASLLFLHQGMEDLHRAHYEQARTSFLAAIQLDPHLWSAYEGLARARRESEGDWKYFVSLSLKGVRQAFSLHNTDFILSMLYWLLQRLTLALQGCFILLAALLALKYGRSVFATTVHDLENRLPHEWWARLAATAVLLLPLLLGFNLLFAASLCLIFLFPFLESRERWAFASACLVLALLTPCYWMRQNLARSLVDHRFRLLFLSTLPSEESYLLEKMQQDLGRGEQPDVHHFHLGTLLGRRAARDESLTHLERVAKTSVLWPLARIQMGNLFYEASEFQVAASHYESALAVRPGWPLAQYNLSLAKMRLGDHQAADEQARLARAKAPWLFAEGERQRVLSASFPESQLVAMGLFGFPSADLTRLTQLPTLAPGLLALATLLGSLLHGRMRNPRLLAKTCEKCGRVFFISESPNSEWCGQCVNLYVRKDDLPSEAKLKKYEQVKAYSSRKRLFAALMQVLCPGARSLFKGHPFGAGTTLFFWLLLISLCFSSPAQIDSATVHFASEFMVFQWILALITLLFWLVFGLRGIWQED